MDVCIMYLAVSEQLTMTLNSEDLYLNRAKFVMKFLGVWVPPNDENIIRKLYRYFMISLQYLFLIFQIIYIIQVWGDLEAVSQASYLLFTQACLCFKVTVFHVNVDLLKELLLQMNGETFRAQSFDHEKILESQAARIKRLLLAFMISSQLTCGMWAVKPLFDDVGSRKFPFDMWMPVTPESSPHYHIGYTFQLVTICMSAYMYFGVDSVALSSVIFGCAQIEIIKDKLMSIQPVDKNANDAINAFSDNYQQLVNCIKHHQAIVRFTDTVENAYHTFLLFQLVGSVGIICMSALRILVVDPRSMQFFSIVSYLSVMISQLFVSCWCGHELTATSEDLHTTLYMCAWKDQNTKFQKELCFAMLRMSRPLVLRAGHYIALSRQTFIMILRMSYSYFAVLNQTVN
ncbi:odorant receptor Or1 [Manduca sexta]|nr:odorant receptor Or1 [Manduca sexta]